MPTPKELRLHAKECLELADKHSVMRTALKELAQNSSEKRAEPKAAWPPFPIFKHTPIGSIECDRRE